MDTPTTDGVDPTEFANEVASWVRKYDLDGVDVDYEVRLDCGSSYSFPHYLSGQRLLRCG
jgi:GH18 family chitinase